MSEPPRHEIERASTTEALPVAPTLSPALEAAGFRRQRASLDARAAWVCVLAAGAALLASGAALVLLRLIAAFTNLAFHGRLSLADASPWDHALGAGVIAVPVLGALVVGLMARFGSDKIRGHGIPEAMEQVLTNESRISPRLTWLKPLSAAVSIGTGGPFGAEGPIIATGGSLGSLVGQVVHVSADERKTLLAAGAAAGMAATFGTPLAAVLLAVELLLFELRPRSLLAVAFAAGLAAALRAAWLGTEPFLAIPALPPAGVAAVLGAIAIGALAGLAARGVTWAVYATEDAFERLPVHWMWWPALGAVVVGVVGWVEPRTLGVGYENIGDVLSGRLALGAVAALCALKFVSWCVALGSGTSGGTLAPLLTVGAGLGALAGAAAARALPAAGLDPHVAALVGMAALFAGASRAVLASIAFAFEATMDPNALLPLLAGCAASSLVASLLAPTTIMTEKIERRGVRVPSEYAPDFLDTVPVREGASRAVVSLRGDQTIAAARAWLRTRAGGARHQGFPVLAPGGALLGVLTARELLAAADSEQPVASLVRREPLVCFEDESLREAADRMVVAEIGRLPVVSRQDPRRVVGILTRSDLLAAHARRLAAAQRRRRGA
jgi:H+/Cl- antiporter ClcA/CBS domain-containing protein